MALNSGVGTGKTQTIRDLLFRFAEEEFVAISSILVCCQNDVSLDRLAAGVLDDSVDSEPYKIQDRSIVDNIHNCFGATFIICENIKKYQLLYGSISP